MKTTYSVWRYPIHNVHRDIELLDLKRAEKKVNNEENWETWQKWLQVT